MHLHRQFSLFLLGTNGWKMKCNKRGKKEPHRHAFEYSLHKNAKKIFLDKTGASFLIVFLPGPSSIQFMHLPDSNQNILEEKCVMHVHVIADLFVCVWGGEWQL